ncbi:uncharacterized protein LACBIDRAFT_310078 [Laccaria bicolor S238N-H82]|uniref:Predicted protein n=1 Tax=Laccaria bicolor (strain S238N-H82 / ATCC MYA-4686) TaxID=486041 RepID=B0DTL8_LACBS|nr:uncharacterized protein LACBIDRAFT_310078 [Laccaria bicolor S238N-H82]EDR02140.1 predicted protein [Laccaria bicolor S238N-H82]|eukprot:XP_001887297.1 predicted protein [Laccaria bicolor S238N-H82]
MRQIWTQTLTLKEPFKPPPEETCMRLSRTFNLSLPLVLDVLYPHLQNATNWAKANELSPNLLDSPPSTTKNMVPSNKKDACVTPFPRLSRFTIIAPFFASLQQ